MIPDRFQYFLNDLWNFEKITKSRPSVPVLLMIIWLTYRLFVASLWLIYAYLWIQYAKVPNGILINIIFG